MTRTPPPEPRAAGAFIALAVIAGATAGMVLHEPSAGILIGGAVGGLVALALWLRDRRR